MPGKYEPVAYDKYILFSEGLFIAVIRKGSQAVSFIRDTLTEAQAILDCYPPDVFEGVDVPWSVFYPRRRLYATGQEG